MPLGVGPVHPVMATMFSPSSHRKTLPVGTRRSATSRPSPRRPSPISMRKSVTHWRDQIDVAPSPPRASGRSSAAAGSLGQLVEDRFDVNAGGQSVRRTHCGQRSRPTGARRQCRAAGCADREDDGRVRSRRPPCGVTTICRAATSWRPRRTRRGRRGHDAHHRLG